jgi:hypothetical protein
MKTIFSFLLVGSLLIHTASAQKAVEQNQQAKPPFSVGEVTPLFTPVGNINFLFSLSAQDYKNQKYVFYTDSTATVAYINIDGNTIRLSGGSNAEGIMTYISKNYTVTLSMHNIAAKAKYANDDHSQTTLDGTLAIYNSAGKVVGKKVTGIKIKAVKN